MGSQQLCHRADRAPNCNEDGLNSDTRVEFPQTEARVEMARVCLHQHHSETKSFHKLAAAAGILPSG